MKVIGFIFLLSISHSLYGQVDKADIDQLVAHHIQHNHFEGSILIAEKGKPVYEKFAGFADREHKRMNGRSTKYSIASITKMLTAIVILQLVEENKISLDKTMDEVLPELDIPKGNKISIHHLLLHISGLPNEKDEVYQSPKTARDFVQTSLQGGKVGKIGKFNYANIDYVLLGLIIEKYAAEGSWEGAITQRIIHKLGLTGTGFLKKEGLPEGLARSYQMKNGTWKADPDFFIENFHAAGSMYSTAEDLLRIDQAMYGNVLLSEAGKGKMYTSYPEYNYTGYGVWTYRYPFSDTKPLIMERRGGIMGANSVLVRLLDSNRTIIILSNNDAFNPDSFGDKSNLREALIMALSEK